MEQGFRTVRHDELHDWIVREKGIPERSVAIDFDDNRTHALTNALPAMRERGFVGNLWVISQLASGADIGEANTRPFGYTTWNLYWDGIHKLKDEGWLIGSHTRTHPFLGELIKEEDGGSKVTLEVKGSQEEIAEHLGEKPLHFCYPGGSYNERSEQIVMQYYRTARIWAPHSFYVYNDPRTNPYRLKSSNISEQVPFDAFKELVDSARGLT